MWGLAGTLWLGPTCLAPACRLRISGWRGLLINESGAELVYFGLNAFQGRVALQVTAQSRKKGAERCGRDGGLWGREKAALDCTRSLE